MLVPKIRTTELAIYTEPILPIVIQYSTPLYIDWHRLKKMIFIKHILNLDFKNNSHPSVILVGPKVVSAHLASKMLMVSDLVKHWPQCYIYL